MKKTTLLVILDGWGLGEFNQANPIFAAKPAAMNYVHCNFPAAALQASGITIGLPWGEEGNSEVGHMTMGIGRVIYQHYPKITMSIEEESFFDNKAIKSAFDHGRRNNSSVHLVGLLSKGNVHASANHIYALIEMAKRENFKEVYLHVFADGRDSPPNSFKELLNKLRGELEKRSLGKISSVIGRYYAMNRDGHWERTKMTYDLITEESTNKGTPEEMADKTLEKKLTDEYILPVQTENYRPIKDNDALIFFNFREDGIKQIASSLADPNFDKFQIKKFENLHIVTMTRYFDEFPPERVAFLPEKITATLGGILSQNDKIQLRIAEKKRYAHVTQFFNGLKSDPYPGEYRIMIPSDDVTRPEDNPEMSASAITERVVLALREKSYDFIVTNYANPDVLAHTGNYEATIKAIKVVDREIGRIIKTAIAEDHRVLITADHGNAESILNPTTGEIQTQHDTSPVPFYIVDKKLFKKRREENSPLPIIGILSDVAPTILELMNLPLPDEMTGQSLVDIMK